MRKMEGVGPGRELLHGLGKVVTQTCRLASWCQCCSLRWRHGRGSGWWEEGEVTQGLFQCWFSGAVFFSLSPRKAGVRMLEAEDTSSFTPAPEGSQANISLEVLKIIPGSLRGNGGGATLGPPESESFRYLCKEERWSSSAHCCWLDRRDTPAWEPRTV